MPDETQYTQHIKLLLVGPANGGKTQLLQKLAGNEYTKIYSPTLAVNLQFFSNSDNSQRFQCWDEAGQARFQPFTTNHYDDIPIALYCVDLSKDMSPQDKVAFNAKIQNIQKRSPDVWVVLVGTKLDAPDATERFKALETFAKTFAKTLNLSVVATSAKDGTGIEQLKTKLCDLAKQPIQPKNVTTLTSDDTFFSEAPMTSAFDQATQALENSLAKFPAKRKKIMAEVRALKTKLKSNTDQNAALQAFTQQCMAILAHQHHPAVKALLTFTAFVFFAAFIGAVALTILGLATGIWVPAAFIAALTAAHAGAIAVVSTAGASAVIAGSYTGYYLFKTPEVEAEKKAIQTFTDDCSPPSQQRNMVESP